MAGFLYSPSHCCCSQLENQPLKIGFQEAAQLYSCQEIEDPVTNVQYLLIRHHRPLLFSVNSRWRSFLIFFFFWGVCLSFLCPLHSPLSLLHIFHDCLHYFCANYICLFQPCPSALFPPSLLFIHLHGLPSFHSYILPSLHIILLSWFFQVL